jgi:hypothetical protein
VAAPPIGFSIGMKVDEPFAASAAALVRNSEAVIETKNMRRVLGPPGRSSRLLRCNGRFP